MIIKIILSFEMPYKDITDLPPAVRDHLPKHAQEIFMEAFNHSFEEYVDPSKRRDKEESNETIAFKVAWAAVKRSYHKKGDHWIKNNE